MTACAQLAASPVFYMNPSGMNSPTISQELRNELLAKGIPALSPPCGAGTVTGLNNENMEGWKRNGWGRPPDANNQTPWLHSDIKNMAFFYIYELFNEMLK